jgi:hypothetical protein
MNEPPPVYFDILGVGREHRETVSAAALIEKPLVNRFAVLPGRVGVSARSTTSWDISDISRFPSRVAIGP